MHWVIKGAVGLVREIVSGTIIVALLYYFKPIKRLATKLVDNAMMGAIDDRIASFFGITVPSVLDFLWSWCIPPALVIAVFLAYHWIRNGQWNERMGRRKLLGLALTTIGALLVLVGVGLLTNAGSQASPDKAQEELKAGATSSGTKPPPPGTVTQSAASPTSVPSVPPATSNTLLAAPSIAAPPPPAVQVRPLTIKEEEALSDLSAIINSKGRAASNLAELLLQITHPMTRNDADQKPSVLRDRAQEIANMVDALDIEIYRNFLPARTFYSKELLAALGTSSTNRVDGAMYPFSQTTLGYVGTLNTALLIADTAKNEQVSRMVLGTTRDSRNQFEAAANNFKKWIDAFNSRVEERRRVK